MLKVEAEELQQLILNYLPWSPAAITRSAMEPHNRLKVQADVIVLSLAVTISARLNDLAEIYGQCRRGRSSRQAKQGLSEKKSKGN